MFAFSAGKIAHYDPKRCGRPSTYTSFVITDDEGNTGNPTYSAPWAVQIRVNSGGGDFAVICGGTLITEKHVLTAAHCFQKKFGGEKTGKPSDKMPGRYCDA
uniref:Peptidase S1 domain-containing protein n=1 Tax=Caenorhabditis japonica TaxID=281687 RepID=A0A8R1ECU8_CAEJA